MGLKENIELRKACDLLNSTIGQKYEAITPRTNEDLNEIIRHFQYYEKLTAKMIQDMDPQDVADKMELLMQGIYELAVTARKERENGFFSFLR